MQMDIIKYLKTNSYVPLSAYKQSVAGLLVSTMFGLLAGVFLGSITSTLERLPGLMILIPAAIGMRGNIFGALGSRLGSAQHAGMFSTEISKQSILGQNIYASSTITIVISVALGIIAYIFALIFSVKSISIFDFIFISVFGGVIASIFLLIITVVISVVGHKKQWDIDNLSAPIITATGDLFALPALLVGAVLLMALGAISKIFIDVGAVVFVLCALVVLYSALKSNMRYSKRIVAESIPILIIAGTINSFAGMTINLKLASFIALPAMLVILPSFLGDNNALGGILAARLSSMLHTGIIEPRTVPQSIVLQNFLMMYLLAMFIFPMAGGLAHIVSVVMHIQSPGLMILAKATTLAGLISVTVVNFLAYYIAIAAYKLGLDPDNCGVPLTSSAIDTVGAVLLVVVFMHQGLI